MIQGVNHITLAARDVEASFAFYRDVLGFTPVARWPRGAYFLCGSLWFAIVYDAQARAEPLPEYSHIAFSVAPEDYATLSRRIVDAGTPLWQQNWTEGDSLYFVDPSGHKLEIHASDLETRLRTAREHPWEGLEILV